MSASMISSQSPRAPVALRRGIMRFAIPTGRQAGDAQHLYAINATCAVQVRWTIVGDDLNTGVAQPLELRQRRLAGLSHGQVMRQRQRVFRKAGSSRAETDTDPAPVSGAAKSAVALRRRNHTGAPSPSGSGAVNAMPGFQTGAMSDLVTVEQLGRSSARKRDDDPASTWARAAPIQIARSAARARR